MKMKNKKSYRVRITSEDGLVTESTMKLSKVQAEDFPKYFLGRKWLNISGEDKTVSIRPSKVIGVMISKEGL